MSRRHPPPAERYVYVIGPIEGLQKIGIATDPKVRMAALQTASPYDLVLHLALAVPFAQAHAIERRAHRLLGHLCVRNEWFEATPADAVTAVRMAVIQERANWPHRVQDTANIDRRSALPLFNFGSNVVGR